MLPNCCTLSDMLCVPATVLQSFYISLAGLESSYMFKPSICVKTARRIQSVSQRQRIKQQVPLHKSERREHAMSVRLPAQSQKAVSMAESVLKGGLSFEPLSEGHQISRKVPKTLCRTDLSRLSTSALACEAVWVQRHAFLSNNDVQCCCCLIVADNSCKYLHR